MEKKHKQICSWEKADIRRRVRMLIDALPDKIMEEEKVKRLLEAADEQEQVRLKVLYNAVVKGVNEYNKNSSQIKLKNWKAAEKELDSYIDKLWVRYIDNEITFPNLLAVIKYLKGQNWKVSKSLAYKHHDEGKIKSKTNGTYRQGDVDKYAATYLKKADGSRPADVLSSLAEEKAQVELEKEKAKLEHLQRKNNLDAGMYVPRDAFQKELAKRLTVFKSDGQNFFRSGAERIIALVGGDQTKAPELIEHQLDSFAAWLNRYAGDKEFKVPVAVIAAAPGDDDKEFEGDE